MLSAVCWGGGGEGGGDGGVCLALVLMGVVLLCSVFVLLLCGTSVLEQEGDFSFPK